MLTIINDFHYNLKNYWIFLGQLINDFHSSSLIFFLGQLINDFYFSSLIFKDSTQLMDV